MANYIHTLQHIDDPAIIAEKLHDNSVIILIGPAGNGKLTTLREICEKEDIELNTVNAGVITDPADVHDILSKLVEEVGSSEKETMLLFDEMDKCLPEVLDEIMPFIRKNTQTAHLKTVFTANSKNAANADAIAKDLRARLLTDGNRIRDQT